MARKRPNPLDHPPAASSSEEEQDEDEELPEQHEEDKRPADASESEEAVGDEDDEDEEEVDEEEPEKIHPPHKPVSKIPNPQSDDESETESESAGFALRPHTSTPASAAKPRNPLKRPVEVEKESKSKAKKKAKPDNEGGVAAKKSGSVRLWSEEDEIAVLKGMIEFHEKKGVDPNSNSTAFHEFVNKSISFDVSKSQLMEKVRRLKNKYRHNAEKSEDPVFSRPHDRKVFELSKTVWGSAGGNVVKNSSMKKKNTSADHNGNFDVRDEEEVDGEEPENEEIRPQYKPVSKIPEMKSGKKSGIDIVWSDEDEVAVLEGMIEFHEKKGVDPNSASTAFHEFVKKSISFDVSKSQLMEKVKRLKNNYMLKAEDSVFSRPHERKVFELSKTVWGSAGGDVVKKKTSSSDHNGKFDVVMALPNPNFTAFNTISKQEPPPQHSKQEPPPQHSKVVVEQGKFADLYPFLYLSLKSSSLAAMMSRDLAETMEMWLVSTDKSKLQELDKEWKKQILDEAQVSMGRSDLLKKQLQLLLATWGSTRG